MSEVVILPEMEVAGEQALQEARTKGLSDADQAVHVYLAMRMVFFMAVVNDRGKEVH